MRIGDLLVFEIQRFGNKNASAERGAIISHGRNSQVCPRPNSFNLSYYASNLSEIEVKTTYFDVRVF